jgi:hypothetical protein
MLWRPHDRHRNILTWTHSARLSCLSGPCPIDPADDLMARDDRHLWVGQVAIDDMQIRAADAASGGFFAGVVRKKLRLDPDIGEGRGRTRLGDLALSPVHTKPT